MTGPDIYESVLGIPPGPRPPNHYELLGLAPLESGESVIVAATDARITEAEESVLASADHIRQVVAEIRQAKACLLDAEAKAAYDRQLKGNVPAGEPINLADAPLDVGRPPEESSDGPPDEPQFEALPTELIDASRPVQGKKRKIRVWFWTFTAVELLCAVALLFYFRPAEPIAMPTLPVRGHVGAGQANPADLPVVDPMAQRLPQPQRGPNRRTPARDPFAPESDITPGNDTARGAHGDENSPVLTDPDMVARTPTPAPPGPVDEPATGTPGKPSAPITPKWPSEWKLAFPANGDWAIDNEMLSLSADEIKALAALREERIYTLRDVSTKKPTAALPFDNQGHLSGIAVALLPKNDWRACLSYNNQVLQGWVMILDAQRQCVCFADYRTKGRAKLFCLCAEGIPVAVQISRGKESAAYLIELAEGRPVARDQKELSVEQAERLAAALAELASIEALIRDCEKDWKAQLTDWWKKHDNALKSISVQPIPDGDKQTRKTAYYKHLFDEQHVGLDKLLSQFGAVAAEPTLPTP